VWRCLKVWSFNAVLFYYPNRPITQAPFLQTLTLIVPSLKVRTLARILPPPCNGIIP
jgi:hypothetical protein